MVRSLPCMMARRHTFNSDGWVRLLSKENVLEQQRSGLGEEYHYIRITKCDLESFHRTRDVFFGGRLIY
jgi:hypothetical protein